MPVVIMDWDAIDDMIDGAPASWPHDSYAEEVGCDDRLSYQQERRYFVSGRIHRLYQQAKPPVPAVSGWDSFISPSAARLI